MFYDPLKRKPYPWAVAMFIILPIVLIFVGYNIGEKYAQKKKSQNQEQGKDIFAK